MRCAVIVLRYKRVLVIVQVEVGVTSVGACIVFGAVVVAGKARVGRESNGRGFVQGKYDVYTVGVVHVEGAVPVAVFFDAFDGRRVDGWSYPNEGE